ncbi:hypothetical protein [Nocardioides lijunqiniae]|uniref:hypothetical protein n=1 Tax=Nocardioides lijunqiniae TaxID=2760832 RepID=UPI0018781CCE|nr:hypothetical protein [Nocardioides lijunqiniae]
MTRRPLAVLLLPLVLVGALTACGGGEEADDAPSSPPSTSGSTADEPGDSEAPEETPAPQETEAPEATGPAAVPLQEDRLCADLSLPDVSAALGRPARVRHDLVAGDPDPILQGNTVAHPYCDLTSGPVSAELIVNTLEPGRPLRDDVRAGLRAVTSAGFLTCDAVAASRVVPGREGFAYTCEGPRGTIGNVVVWMGPEWALNCAVTGGTQDRAKAVRSAARLCAVAVGSLVG